MLTLFHAGVFSPQIDLGWHVVGADGTVRLSFGVVFYECFHLFLHFIRRKILCTGCSNFVKNLKCGFLNRPPAIGAIEGKNERGPTLRVLT